MKKEFGGCAANIAYNLNALGDNCTLLGTVGKDSDEYIDELKNCGIDTSQLIKCSDQYTAQAFITTDSDGNQITSFHPGAMMNEKVAGLANHSTSIGIISPNSHHAMTKNANEFFDRGIHFIFDPGQALPMFDISDLKSFVSKSSWITVNKYEGEILSKKLQLTLEEITQKLLPKKNGGIIQTLGDKGCKVFTKENYREISAIKISNAVDPTGCGDAFRAGMLFALSRQSSLEDSACLGNVLGSIKVQKKGAQNHSVNVKTIMQELRENYSEVIINFEKL